MIIKVAASAVVLRGNFILMGRKPDGKPPYPGKLVLPGGSVRPQETVSDCVVRKVAEESGAEVSVGEKLNFGEDFIDMADGSRAHFIFLVHEAEYVAGTLKGSDGFEDPHWIPRSELQRLSDEDELAGASIRLFREIGWTSR